MTSREFCYWLQGYFEICAANPAPTSGLTATQAKSVKRHLNMVFAHEIDPSAGPPEVQEKLNKIHGPGSFGPPLNY